MRMCAEPEDDGYCDQVEQLVRDYFTSHPSGVVRIGNYTPRGRKRRGLHTKQHRLFCVQTGTVRHYFPGVVFCGSPGYDTPTVTLTRTRATVPCRCYGVDRSVVPLHTIVWAAPN